MRTRSILRHHDIMTFLEKMKNENTRYLISDELIDD